MVRAARFHLADLDRLSRFREDQSAAHFAKKTASAHENQFVERLSWPRWRRRWPWRPRWRLSGLSGLVHSDLNGASFLARLLGSEDIVRQTCGADASCAHPT
jgi:hypothetical protein